MEWELLTIKAKIKILKGEENYNKFWEWKKS